MDRDDVAAGHPRKEPGKAGIGRPLDGVAVPVIIGMDVRPGRFDLRRNVLEQRAAERYVDQLLAATDAEHRLAGFHELVQQLHLVGVTHAVAGPVRMQGFLAVRLRADVGAALQDQAVEVLRIVGEADAAAVHDAVTAHRRDHEHHHLARHDPVRDRLLQVLQRFRLDARGAGLRVVDARRKANAQGTSVQHIHLLSKRGSKAGYYEPCANCANDD